MTDLASYLRGYTDGYWEGYDFAVAPPEEWSESVGGSAPGPADASSPATPPDPTARRCAPAAPAGAPAGVGSRGSASSSLPAIRQGALPGGVEPAGGLEAIYIHRGVITGLRMIGEVFHSRELHEAFEICEKAIRGIELEVEER